MHYWSGDRVAQAPVIGGGSFYEVGGLATDDQLLMHA